MTVGPKCRLAAEVELPDGNMVYFGCDLPCDMLRIDGLLDDVIEQMAGK